MIRLLRAETSFEAPLPRHLFSLRRWCSTSSILRESSVLAVLECVLPTFAMMIVRDGRLRV